MGVKEIEESNLKSTKDGLLMKIGRFMVVHRKSAIAIWILALLSLATLSTKFGATYINNLSLPNNEAATGQAILSANNPGKSAGYSSQIVITGKVPISSLSNQISQAATNLAKLPNVTGVVTPLQNQRAISSSGQTGYIVVQFNLNPVSFPTTYFNQVETAMNPVSHSGESVYYADPIGQLSNPKASDIRSELIGLLVAIAVALFAFRSLYAAIIPIFTAVISVLVGYFAISLIGRGITFGTSAPTLTVMIGLGVGIDYALFLTTRHRQHLKDGDGSAASIARTVSTSGRSVIVAAITVALALLGLYVSGITFIGNLGLAASLGVASSAIGALTLVPAILGIVAEKIDKVSLGEAIAESHGGDDFWHRFAKRVQRAPITFLVIGVALGSILVVPLFSIRINHLDASTNPSSYSDTKAFNTISSTFGAGANAQLTVVVEMNSSTLSSQNNVQSLETRVASAITQLPNVVSVSPPTLTSSGKVFTLNVIPKFGPSDQTTKALFDTLTTHSLPSSIGNSGNGYVVGGTASTIIFVETVVSKLPLIIIFVIATAFIVLLAAFRSIWIPIKAALLNLFSIGAAYGVVVAVFQWGWGSSLLGMNQKVPIESYVPMMMFAITFGLSMDYEVFLISRVKEAYLSGMSADDAVANGLSATARVISSAAAIMISVFFAFIGSTAPVIKMLGLGLGVSVLIDATIIRLTLVPAVMTLLGDKAWYIPRWLDKVVPAIEVE
ncbi:MAG: MMPL family transporter [Actinomycetota bacterium]|nr:MMPL family transporter [Actinomycetota bacterium]